MLYRNISPRPRKSRSNTSSVRSISPQLVIINRDQNDALRRDVEEIVINFVNAREKGYNFVSVADCITKTIDKQIHEPNLIFYWLLNNQNTVQYITLLGFFYFQDINQSIGQENKRKGFHLFLTAAKMDYSIAQDLVADCYCFGHGTPKNPDLSFEWYQKATHNGSIDGEFGLGYCYDMGIGVKSNLIKAIQHYKNSSKKENRSAMFLLAQCYDLGLGVEKDYEQAINLYKKAIEHGNTDAYHHESRNPSPTPKLSKSRNASPTPKISKSRSQSPLRPHSRSQSPLRPHSRSQSPLRPHSRSQSPLLSLHSSLSRCTSPMSSSVCSSISREESDAIKRIVDEIADKFIELKDKGHLDEKITKFIYEIIISNDREPFQIYDWLSSNQNTVQHITLLGYFYLDSIGTNEDLKKSFNCFLTASKKDYPIAQDFLADCYNFGLGTIKNEELCFQWYNKAYEGGSINAEYELGECYKSGFGSKERNVKIALEHFKNSAKKGNISSMYWMGWCHEKGIGTDRDLNVSINWYKKALKNGNLMAQNSLDKLQYKLNKSIQTSSNPSSSEDEGDENVDNESSSPQNQKENSIVIPKHLDESEK
ncbi:5583_t:CDS:2 [Diversispora eburnea]|uniref:5583_t:CDS:1 n=1 Tax=Diversispora eburnea TaxID=1213867 RepID=A0A9N8VBW4_9GLOM|nr:5583_t:CDS:2 [Diversispora eburnea]